MIVFKSGSFEPQFDELDNRLKHIIYALAGFIENEFKKDLVITSVWRHSNTESTHYYYRAIDFRIHQSGQEEPYYTEEETIEIEKFLGCYRYDSSHLTLRIHGEPPHGHLQVNREEFTRLYR
jgi:hypothetical protein